MAAGIVRRGRIQARIRLLRPLASLAPENRTEVGLGVKMLARGVAAERGLISECARMRVPTGRLRIVSTQPTEGAEVHEGPPSPGRYIREARQRRGISIEQLALETKIPRPSLEALEEDQFSTLPGPVFVRGFFRCCARSLSLDPETVAGLLHDHLQAQKAGAQRGTRRPTAYLAAKTPAAPVQAVAGPRKPARAEGAKSKPATESANRPTALAAAPAAAAEVSSNAALQAVYRVGAQSLDMLRALNRIPQSRTLMWIAVCLVIAVIAVTAFALSGGQVTPPHS
ncbi:helix-turn-helix transcriptional regulator [Nannocystis sp. SCPEA4]|uniref:helix-turn-helix domain-containing protein n=1 Tax=Nannocystis sp. SCPEA4 TaxID=2996787 RepID=UPI00226D6097|nr:helix-turn-helix transcriptional regulator [Nannocystis sp. SCPEA4]MCY1058136.1 helix-turn-helix transcriptional regulator [Nannocystis sp. SCPEA4]